MDSTKDDSASYGERWVCRAPLLAAAALICLINGFNLVRLVRADAPRNPWEAVQIVEAWRHVQRLPVYEQASPGHSTHVYGAWAPLTQGEVLRRVGLNNVAGRLLSLVSALVTVTVLTVVMGRGDRRGAWALVVSWALILSVNYRSWEYFAENRPDLPALMMATLGVVAMAYGQESGRRSGLVLGTLCVATGFFFKQTAAIVTVVPALALLLRGRRPTRAELLWSLFPFAFMLGVIAVLKVVFPTVYYYMITAPKAFPTRPLPTVRDAWELLLETPLFLLLLAEWLLFDVDAYRKDSRLRWLVAVLAVTIPFSALTSAKAGGATNSLLPGLFAMAAFCALRLPRLLTVLENRNSPWPSRLLAGTFLAVIVLMTAFPRFSTRHSLVTPRSPHDRVYWKLVDHVKQLPGKVLCPEDPTIPLYAKGEIGLNIFSEYDNHLVDGQYPTTPPDHVRNELDGADYLVDVQAKTQDILNDANLASLGFERVTDVGSWLDGSDYKLWRRQAAGAKPVASVNAGAAAASRSAGAAN